MRALVVVGGGGFDVGHGTQNNTDPGSRFWVLKLDEKK
jgi:hypothetical protein